MRIESFYPLFDSAMTKNIYTHVSQAYGKILFRGYKNGKRIQSKLEYSPTLYVPTSKESEIKSLYGKNLEARKFDSLTETKAWYKENKDMLAIHGNTKYEYAFIHEFFPGELNVSVSDLTLESIDIETTVENGFPDVLNPVEEVLLITFIDAKTKKTTTFGSREYTGKFKDRYVTCSDETDLLQKAIGFIENSDPDIITGWNCVYFDIAYLCARIEHVLGETWLSRLSPFGKVERSVDMIHEREKIRYEIVGRSVLDMLDLYKKFRFINRESYKLDFIAEVELGKRKLDNPYESFKDHYTLGWDHPEFSFVDYNIIDAQLVDELEENLGFVYLAVVLTYLAKVNYGDVFSPVKLWECFIKWSLKEENIFIPTESVNNKSNYTIEGGYVADPTPGFYEWIACGDATSLYPFIIMCWNMSPETLVGMKPGVGVQELLSGEIKNTTEHAMAANGAMFSKESQGIMPRLSEKVFNDRKKAKKTMLVYKTEMSAVETEMKRRGISI